VSLARVVLEHGDAAQALRLARESAQALVDVAGPLVARGEDRVLKLEAVASAARAKGLGLIARQATP
jgi:hypothetical protein